LAARQLFRKKQHPLVGRTDGWSHRRREALDKTPLTDRLTIAPKAGTGISALEGAIFAELPASSEMEQFQAVRTSSVIFAQILNQVANDAKQLWFLRTHHPEVSQLRHQIEKR
jgi:hypothetical protein